MAKSKIPTLLTGLFLLFLVVQLIFQASMGMATSIDTNEETANFPMISGVLAHEMNESQAQNLATIGIWVEADVEINRNGTWQNIYELSKNNGVLLIGK